MLLKVQGKVLSHANDYTGISHRHDFSELVIITSGQGVHNVNGTAYPVAAGDVFVIAGNTTHYFEEYANLGITNLLYDPRLLEGMQEYLNRIPGYHVIFRFEPELRTSGTLHHSLHLSARKLAQVLRMIEQIGGELQHRHAGWEAASVGLLLELTVFLARALENPFPAHIQSTALARLALLTSRLESSFQEEWDLPRMAKSCGISVNTLLRTFQSVVHQTPLQYLSALRLNAAAAMLKNGTMPVSEIAFACGFHDSNYFSKCFRKHFHCTPSSYRRL